MRGRSTTTAMGERGTEQGALPAPAGLRIAASTKRKAEAAGATPLGPRQKQACRRMGASSSRAGAASPKAADRQLATAAAATGGAAVALSGAGIAGRAAGLSEARSDVITLRETPFAGVKVPTTAEQTKLIANATFSPEEEHAEQMLFKQASFAVLLALLMTSLAAAAERGGCTSWECQPGIKSVNLACIRSVGQSKAGKDHSIYHAAAGVHRSHLRAGPSHLCEARMLLRPGPAAASWVCEPLQFL